MDGLLLDTERVGLISFLRVTAPLGLPESRAEGIFLDLVGGSAAMGRARLTEELPTGLDLDAFDISWNNAFGELVADGLPVKEGVAEMLDALAAQGWLMAVVTSTRTARARAHLGEAGLIGHFRTVIGGDMVTANKPDPAPYLAGAEAVSQAPGACLAFEDSDRGTASAVAAGCRVWQIPDLRPKGRELPALGQNIARSLPEAMAAAGLI